MSNDFDTTFVERYALSIFVVLLVALVAAALYHLTRAELPIAYAGILR